MDKLPLQTYDIYSDRDLLDKRDFPDWVEQNKYELSSAKSIKRINYGDEFKKFYEDTQQNDVSVADRKGSTKTIYNEPTLSRRHMQDFNHHSGLNDQNIEQISEFYTSISTLINRVWFFFNLSIFQMG